MRKLSFVIVLGLVSSSCGKPAAGPGRREEGKPLETKAPEAKHQKPAFAGQTRAPFHTAHVRFETKVIAKGLEHPWSLAFLPQDRLLVTERPGRLRIVRFDGTISEPIAGVPNPAPLSIGCTPSCGVGARGSFDGFFAGRSGQRAGLIYNLGGNSGAIAFGRPGGG